MFLNGGTMKLDLSGKTEKNKGVLIIYTGGTMGCAKKHPENPESPLGVLSWECFSSEVSVLSALKDEMIVDGHEIYPPLDSTNMAPADWKTIAKAIGDNYHKYEGFVVVHGTDTMIYTAAALSFMLENLQKPVILTGSQLPLIKHTRNDGAQNLVNSVYIANAKQFDLPVVPEVCICFNNTLLRGNRARKLSASEYDGFSSPNFPPLGKIGEHIKIYSKYMLKRDPSKQFKVNTQLEANVSPALIFPGIQNGKVLHNIVETDKLRGLILLAYGTGNVPTHPNFLDAIDIANSKGQVVLDVTQSNQGTVELGVYETSAVLLERGVVSGSDITPEAAICKLMVLLGDEDKDIKDVMKDIQTDVAGEQSKSVFSFNFPESLESLETLEINKTRWRKPLKDLGSRWANDSVEKVALRLYGATLKLPEGKTTVELSCFIGINSTDELEYGSQFHAGTFKRSLEDFSSMVILDITKAFMKLVSANKSTSFTLVMENVEIDYCLTWEKTELAIFTDSGTQ